MKYFINLYKKNMEIINYVVVGACTTFISLLSYYICVFTFLDPTNSIQLQIANIISWICAVTFAYFSNRIFVFKSKEKKKIKESIKFFTSRIVTLLIDMLFMFLLVSVMSFNDKISKILVQFIVLILNYVFSKLFVFNNKRVKE